MKQTCTQCGNEYKVIAQHWIQSSCDHPSFTDHQKEIITGLLMGDGCINREDNKNPRIRVEMISPNYLEYVDKKFATIGKGVSLNRTAGECAKNSIDSGFNPNAKKENYNNVYLWRSMQHPELKEFADWYSSGKKVWPSNIELTPTVLKHWYCCDGTWNNTGSRNYIRIAMSNEINNADKVSQMFVEAGLSRPSNYTTKEAEFTVEQSKKLWDYMGEPLPDFEYKWPNRYC